MKSEVPFGGPLPLGIYGCGGMQKEKPGFEVIPNWNQIEPRTALKSGIAADQLSRFFFGRRVASIASTTAVAASTIAASTTVASTCAEIASASTSAKVAAAAMEAA
jgi:hypothetical protein